MKIINIKFDTKHEEEIITWNRFLLVDEYEKDSLIDLGVKFDEELKTFNRWKMMKYNNIFAMKNSIKLIEGEITFILDDGGSIAYENISAEYNHSVFGGFEKFLRTKRIDEEDNIYVLNLYKSHFVEYKLEPGIYGIIQVFEELKF